MLKYQRVTSNGRQFQSFNISERNYREIEQYFINVYVNNEAWTIVDSILDMSYNQKAVMVRTGLTSGIDIFFGNGDFGKIPDDGSMILVEYVVSDGIGGNAQATYMNNADNPWKFSGVGYMEDNSTVQLNGNFSIELVADLIFGASSEDIGLTQLIAPHTSRAFVLANETNYKYFLQRTGIFSSVEIIKGYSS